jgi:predicted transposase YbfD/YdcC
VIYIERIFSSKNGYHHTHSFYISSLLSNDAKLFASGIRGHWSIENNLHWVKDVILKEDTTKHKKGSAAKNMSILRNIAINVFRENDYSSTKHATLFFASNVKELLKIILRT